MASTSFALHAPINGLSFPASSSRAPNPGRSVRISAAGATSHAAQTQAPSFYEVLGIRTGATCQEIKSAYRRLARVLHPDAAPSGGAADEFMRLHSAYATLSDPEKREVYDRSLLRRPRVAVVSSAVGCYDVGRRRRTWETDQCW